MLQVEEEVQRVAELELGEAEMALLACLAMVRPSLAGLQDRGPVSLASHNLVDCLQVTMDPDLLFNNDNLNNTTRSPQIMSVYYTVL